MAGVKGRSGRKPDDVAAKRLETIEKAWDTVHEFLNDLEQPLKARAEMAAKLAVKNMPQEIKGDVGLNVTMMPTISKDGKTLEFNIGEKPKGDISESTATENP